MSQLISVIIPTYNRESFLLRAINSVLAQDYQYYELIVVDDGSADETEKLLTPLASIGKIKYFKCPNRGVSAARNFGVKQASGELISFLDSDDEWLPHKLRQQINYFIQNPEGRIVYGEELWIRNGKRVNQKAIHKKSGGLIFRACVLQCLIAPSSVMLSRNLFDEMGGFDERFVVCEDYDLWLKISSLMEIGFISEPLIIKHGGHLDQLSTKYVAMDFWRLKSLLSILETRELKLEDQLLVIDSMKRRGAILLQGYQKHGNIADYQVVEQMLQGLEKL